MSATGRTYQGESAEQRLRARRQLLIDTCFRLMASDMWRQVSLNQLCREAGLSKRYFYESFADLVALEDAVADDLASRLMGAGFEAAQAAQDKGLSTEQLARHVMSVVVDWLLDDPLRARVLFAGVGANPRAQEKRKAVIRQLANALAVFGQEYHEAREQLDAKPGRAIGQAGAALLIGGSIEMLLGWLDGDIALSREELVESLSGFWVAVGSDAVAQTKRRIAAAAAPKTKKPAAPRRKPAQ